jgi:predicted nucleotidyltransferase
MTTLSETSLAPDERTLLERYVEELHTRLGDHVHAVWLFGSRARGEPRSVHGTDWLTQRRAIRSFFVAELAAVESIVD